jgi:uncharacterized phage protein (TIGR01671 family)
MFRTFVKFTYNNGTDDIIKKFYLYHVGLTEYGDPFIDMNNAERQLDEFLTDDEFFIFIEQYGDVDQGVIYLENFEVEQCTGLSDKNGKFIYENDIINYHDEIIGSYIVNWQDGGWFIGETSLVWFHFENKHNIEIVGNVHDGERNE